MSAALIALAAMLAATAPAPANASLQALPALEDAQVIWYRIDLGQDCDEAFEVLLPWNVLTECELVPYSRR